MFFLRVRMLGRHVVERVLPKARSEETRDLMRVRTKQWSRCVGFLVALILVHLIQVYFFYYVYELDKYAPRASDGV